MRKNKEYKTTCMDCRYFDCYDDDENLYHCSKKDVDINLISETEGEAILDREICEDFNEARYRITEKGIFTLVLNKLEICNEFFDEKIYTAWDIFVENMKAYGYYKESGEDEKPESKVESLIKKVKSFFIKDKNPGPDDLFKTTLAAVFDIENENKLDAAWVLFVKYMQESNYFPKN